MTTKRSILAVGSAALLVLAACGDDTDEAVDTASPATQAPTTAAPGTEVPGESTITVAGAWARTSPMTVENGAAYMVITSSIDDRLLSAAVSTEVAMEAQVHEVVMADGDTMTGDTMAMSDDTMAMTGDTMAPSMMMQEVDSIDLPAGESVALEPGGYHIMLMGLTEPLESGQEFVLTLTFEQAGDVEVTVVVADEAPMS